MEQDRATRRSGSFLGLFNMFSGGALEQLSIFALGIMPYISASHHPPAPDRRRPQALERAPARKASRAGARSTSTRATAPSCCRSSSRSSSPAGSSRNNRAYAQFGEVVTDPGWGFRLMTMLTLTTGTAFIMWLGEQITERGIGNGISLIIFAGIVTDIPTRPSRMFSKAHDGRHHSLSTWRVIGLIVVAGRRGDRLLRARRSDGSRSSTPSAWSAGRSTAARRRTCRSR